MSFRHKLNTHTTNYAYGLEPDSYPYLLNRPSLAVNSCRVWNSKVFKCTSRRQPVKFIKKFSFDSWISKKKRRIVKSIRKLKFILFFFIFWAIFKGRKYLRSGNKRSCGEFFKIWSIPLWQAIQNENFFGRFQCFFFFFSYFVARSVQGVKKEKSLEKPVKMSSTFTQCKIFSIQTYSRPFWVTCSFFSSTNIEALSSLRAMMTLKKLKQKTYIKFF